jgi:hypothetical protein
LNCPGSECEESSFSFVLSNDISSFLSITGFASFDIFSEVSKRHSASFGIPIFFLRIEFLS